MEIKKLVDEHWKYIEGLLMVHGETPEKNMRVIEYHYKTAMLHGYKHGQEEAQKAFRPV